MIAMYVEHNPQARLGRVVTKIVTSIVKKSGLESSLALWVYGDKKAHKVSNAGYLDLKITVRFPREWEFIRGRIKSLTILGG